jgi:hypothetical protein
MSEHQCLLQVNVGVQPVPVSKAGATTDCATNQALPDCSAAHTCNGGSGSSQQSRGTSTQDQHTSGGASAVACTDASTDSGGNAQQQQAVVTTRAVQAGEALAAIPVALAYTVKGNNSQDIEVMFGWLADPFASAAFCAGTDTVPFQTCAVERPVQFSTGL